MHVDRRTDGRTDGRTDTQTHRHTDTHTHIYTCLFNTSTYTKHIERETHTHTHVAICSGVQFWSFLAGSGNYFQGGKLNADLFRVRKRGFQEGKPAKTINWCCYFWSFACWVAKKKSMAGYSYNYWTEDSQAAAIFCFICGCNPKVLPQNCGLREANGHGSKMRHKSNGCTNVPNGCCCCFFIQLGVSTFLNHVHTMQRFGRPDVHCPFDFFFGGILPGSPWSWQGT